MIVSIGSHHRSFRLRAFSFVAAALVCAVGANSPLQAQLPPLIPRSVILEESERGNPTLSPDGKRIAYCAPYNGVQNIWVRTTEKDDDRAVTSDVKDGISYCLWTPDGENVLYFQDRNGDENRHLFQTNIHTGKTTDLTPYPGVQAMGLLRDPQHPDTLLIHLNTRDSRLFDVHRLDLKTGRVELDTQNPGDVSQFYADHSLRVRVAYVTKPDNSAEVRVRNDIQDPWKTLISWGPDEMNSDNTGVVGFASDDTKILVITSVGANAERLQEVDLRTGATTVLSEDPQFDVTGLLINPINSRLEAVAYEKERTTWVVVDPSIQDDFKTLAKIRTGDFSIRSRDRSDSTWLLKFTGSSSPTTYYLYDRPSRKATFLFSEDPKLEKIQLAEKEPIKFSARDGMIIYGYLTIPVGLPRKNLPLVVRAHGGPWTRDRSDLDFQSQCLANRGYAVLEVNFRGSTGYGKAYQNAGNLQWGGKVIQDIVDGKNWVVAQGIADPKRIAIMGGSFGGYAVLTAVTFHPREFTCGIAMNAISDANFFLASLPPHWTVGRARFETRMGKDPEFLRGISPLHKADQVTSPLLIMHNANDVRVKLEHSTRMVESLRKHGKDVTYLVFPDAGHVSGGGNSNFLRRWAIIEDFLGRHLGGRVEPPSEVEKWESLLK